MVSSTESPSATALELVKQIITLASGVLVLSATFIQQFSISNLGQLALLVMSWLFLIGAVLAGLQSISAIIRSQLNGDQTWATGRGRRIAMISKHSFVLGLTTFATFALLTLLLARDQS